MNWLAVVKRDDLQDPRRGLTLTVKFQADVVTEFIVMAFGKT